MSENDSLPIRPDSAPQDGYTPNVESVIPDSNAMLSEDAPATPKDSEPLPDGQSPKTDDGPNSDFVRDGSSHPVPSGTEPPVQKEHPAEEPEKADGEETNFDASEPEEDDSPTLAEAAGMDDYEVTLPAKRRVKKASPKKRLFIILTAVFALLAILAVCGICYVYYVIHPYASYDKIMPNVYCAGVDLGGMTRDEAQAAIEEALSNPSYSVKVILPDCQYTFQPEQKGITLNGAEVAQRAYDYGRSDTSAYGLYQAYHRAKKTQYQLDAQTDLEYNTDDIQKLADQINQETNIDPTESTVSFDDSTHTVTLSLGTPGRRIDAKTIVDAVSSAFDSMNFSDITLTYEKVEIDMDAVKQLTVDAGTSYDVAVADPIVAANSDTHAIDVTIGTQGWTLDTDSLYASAEAAVKDEAYGEVSQTMTSIEPADVDITSAYSELACDPVEPYYSGGTVVEGSNGYTLDWNSAVAQILACTYGQQISIPMTAIAPSKTAADIKAVLFRDQLSTFSTAYASNANRTNNLTLACKAINGTVINAGETFSFNNVVGQRTAAKGYKEATVYVGSESVEEVGGGICQVASTIYDAALYAEMKITSRACHTFFVTYVPGGLDATVYWGVLDFAFKNNTDYPIRVNASVSGGYVNISIDGTKTNDHVVKLSSTKLSTTPYETVYKNDSSKPSGYEEETTYPYTGYTYEAYQYIYDGNGNLIDTIYLGKSTYQKRDRVITVGTG